MEPLGLFHGLFASVFALAPLLLAAFVVYVFWNVLQTLRSIDRNMAEVAKSLRIEK